jgi:hypothetical protein
VKTVVVMVPPTGLAETVMPPSFSPAAEVMLPLSTASAALAGERASAATMTGMASKTAGAVFMS